MKLYYSPGACSLAPHIVAREAGIDLALEKVDLKAKKTEKGDDYRKINPKGYVPALQLDDGSVMTEASVLVQFLADRAPGAKLMPACGSHERYRAQEALNFVSSELHKQFSPLFDPALADPARAAQVDRIGQRLDLVEQALGDKPYWSGDAFTAVDAYLFTIVNWAGVVKIDLARWPKVQEYRKRVAARPKVQAALQAEGLVK